jgi:hypothetical protein
MPMSTAPAKISRGAGGGPGPGPGGEGGRGPEFPAARQPPASRPPAARQPEKIKKIFFRDSWPGYPTFFSIAGLAFASQALFFLIAP